MLIYITGYVQFSIFSSGHHQMTLQMALAMKQLMPDSQVKIVNILENKDNQWEDFNPEVIGIPIIHKSDTIQADLLIDTIGCLSGEERQKMAKKTVLFIREPPIFNELEKCIYPANTLKRSYEGLTEIWTYDLFTHNDCIMLNLLGNCNVRMLPFTWSPLILDTYCKKNNILPWFMTTNVGTNTHLMIAETNMSNKSNCTIPLTIWHEFSLSNKDLIEDVKVANGKHLEDRKFFKDNIFAHVGSKAVLEGRSRSVDWTMNPKTILLAHLRFSPIRWLYLDCAWMGIPIVHNCLLLKQLGEELADFYYSNNSISEGAAALKRCCDNVSQNDYFNEKRLVRTRYVIENGLSILRPDAKDKWSAAVSHVINVTDIYRIQFAGMWADFVYDYNFFTLLIENYFKEKGINKKVIGCGPEYKGADINIRILGPFKCNESLIANIPTVFTTSENIGPLSDQEIAANCIQLQLGYSRVAAATNPNYMRLPLWMMSINWFDADNDRLVNPRLIPLEKCLAPKGAKGRSKFCAFIVSNPCNEIRNAAFELINERVGHVDSAGRFKNNCGEGLFAGPGGGSGEEKKVAFLEDYRFNITYENSYGEGYVTEKIFHAKAATCIPIYWGDSSAVVEDFDCGGFIDAKKMSDEQLVDRIRFLESPEGEEERIKIAETPMFSRTKAADIRSYLMTIAERITNIKLVPNKLQNEYVVYGRNYG